MRYVDQFSKTKIMSLFICLCIGLCIIITRLIQLQIIDHHRFAHLSTKNFVRFKTVPAPRGSIFDRNGAILATNRPVTNLIWQGSGNYRLTDQQHKTLDRIVHILDQCNNTTLFSITNIIHAERYAKTAHIASDIPFDALCQISEQCADCSNIYFDTNFTRYYPHKTLACHTLGYLGDINVQAQGKMGLEKILHDTLQGEQGMIMHTINSFGSKLTQKQIKHVQPGQNIYTTLDLQTQQYAEESFTKGYEGTLIACNPHTGEIKAVLSRPYFDPTIFLQPIDSTTWQHLQINRPFLNRAFNACYPPASTFKLITFAAALEKRLVQPDDDFFCKGYHRFCKRNYYCNNRYGHRWLSLTENLAHSCNIACYQIAQKLYIDDLAHYALVFGLGTKTSALFTEKHGLVPSNEWKIMTKGERWWTGETLSAAIGQSFLLTTPIQIARMIGAIFTGYLVTPRIILNQPIEKTPLQVSNSTRLFLQQGMRLAVEEGTARRLNKIQNCTIYAKTGTAQTSAWKKRKLDKKYKEHAWFVAYLQTPGKDDLVIVVVVEHTGTSRYATNIAKKFIKKYVE